MGRNGPFFSMFSRIGFVCMPVKISFFNFLNFFSGQS